MPSRAFPFPFGGTRPEGTPGKARLGRRNRKPERGKRLRAHFPPCDPVSDFHGSLGTRIPGPFGGGILPADRIEQPPRRAPFGPDRERYRPPALATDVRRGPQKG